MELSAVANSYARWAPIYDRTFGAATRAGRHAAVRCINAEPGRVLEVGVGTGLALPHYSGANTVIGVDYSDEMLAKAREKVAEKRLAHVEALRQMDARALDFDDNSFDWVAAMHMISVVPEPERVMAEMARVLKPGGQIVITNHFARDGDCKSGLARIERFLAPFANKLGWHSDFSKNVVLQTDGLVPVVERELPPMGMMTLLVLEKRA